MFRISYSDFTRDIFVSAFCDVVITDSDKNLVFASVAGSDSAVKAMVAVSHTNRSKDLSIEDSLKTGKLKTTLANVEGEKKFRSMTSKIGDLTHGIVVSEDAVAETESQCPVVIAWDGDTPKAFYETLLAKYPVPLLPEWQTYLFNQCVVRGFVENLTVSSINKPILAIRLKMKQDDLKSIIKEGFTSGKLHLRYEEENSEDDGGNIREIRNVTDYLNSYGVALARRLNEVFKPYHRPGIDELSPKLNQLMRKPFRAQADVAMGITKALQDKKRRGLSVSSAGGLTGIYNNRGAVIVGEMGAGKTILGLVVAHLLHDKPFRVIVMVPGHLVKKWKREVEETIPNARGIILRDYKEVLALRTNVGTKPKVPEFYIISRDRAKLGYYQRRSVKWTVVKTKHSGLVKQGWVCPSCGQIVHINVDGDQLPADYDDFETMKTSNLKCTRVIDAKTGKLCNSKLWSADNSRVRRMAPADLMKKYFKGFFDLFIADEVHEYKGATAQGNSFGALIGIAKKTLALTGTLMGGYSSNLFRILFRMDPQSLLKEDIGYTSESKWVGRYGVLEKVYKIQDEEVNRMSRGGKGKASIKEKPGVSPQMFTRFLLSRCAFLELADLAEHLPAYTELIELVEMDPELEDSYRSLAMRLRQEMLEQLRQGKKKLLGTYLNVLLSYPDKPYDNADIIDKETGKVLIRPDELPSSELYGKERRLVEIALEEKKKGRKCLIYAQFTGKKDIQERLAETLRREGLRVEILRSTVKPENRENWVLEKAPKVDCIICNPKLVETGLDLLDFPTIVFYQTGYNLFTLRQASRRSWRIGQKHPVKVYFLAYQNTLQEAALRLMGAKLEASLSLEGKFSEEGLRAMGEGLDLSSALAKALVEGMDHVDSAEAIWSRMGYGIIDGDDEVPEIIRVTNDGQVQLVKVVVSRVPSRKKKDKTIDQYSWNFFEEAISA